MRGSDKSSFWPSYVDIMTTLFAIMLVLFAVSYSRFKIKEKQLQGLVDEYENIITVYSTVASIDSTAYFGYDEKYLKHLFTVNVEYQEKEYRMDKLKFDLSDPQKASLKRDSVIMAGKLVKKTILNLERQGAVLDNIKFLVVIEGQSSKIAFNIDDWKNNYTLSYLRAQFLNEFWKKHGIDFASLPKCELIISGSGEGGVPRVVPTKHELEAASNGDENRYWQLYLNEEKKNQRFLIHIVPVIGNIEITKAMIDEIKGKKSDSTNH
jgi:hypothetical protein